MNQILKNIYDTNKVLDKNGIEYALEAETSFEEGEYLHNLIIETGALRTLETGMAYGISSLWICEALRRNGGTKHIAIDPAQHEVPELTVEHEYNASDPGWRGIGVSNIEKAGFSDLLELHTLSSHSALPSNQPSLQSV